MKDILGYLRSYWDSLDKKIFGICSALIAVFIYLNYHFGISPYLNHQPFAYSYIGWYFVFLLAFTFPYTLAIIVRRETSSIDKKLLLLLLLAPAIFAWKIAANFHFTISADSIDNAYWNKIIYWPLKLMIIAFLLLIAWRFFNPEQPFYGTLTKGFKAKPYFIMLFIMIPLIAAASTQHDFLTMYPKLKSINKLITPNEGWKKLLYELSYGSDFLGIELFFRGFLILAFAKWVGKDAILPMALFYCTIHFGKPLGECISSFFGGLILGVVTYHSRTIWGGLLVHLGIAWMMELGGYMGNLYF